MVTRIALMTTIAMLVGGVGTLSAGPIYDFSTLSGGTVINLGTGATTIGPVTAEAFSLKAGVWGADYLIARNEPGDHGLGVCAEGLANCSIGGTGDGDDNELSQLTVQEAIRLTATYGYSWTELWVSSLDSGGTGGSEEGRLYWGNDGDILALLAGPSFVFKYPDFGAGIVEGDILGLAAAAGFDPGARYVLFVPYGALGDNNDYLVYGASGVAVPEPATLALLGLGFAGFSAVRRRRRV